MQEAFIIGNGPSLTIDILDRLKDKTTFAVNRISSLFDQTEWRPNYYIAVTDAIADKRHAPDIIRAINESEFVYCRDTYYKFLPGTRVTCSETGDVATESVGDSIWSDDITKRVSKFGISVFPALQIAAFLGFDVLYLIGCDGGYTKPKGGVDLNHFDGAYRVFDPYPNYDYERLNGALHKAHKIAQNAADRLGIDIINLSPISEIKAHVFGDLNTVL